MLPPSAILRTANGCSGMLKAAVLSSAKRTKVSKRDTDFEPASFGHVGFELRNLVRALWYGLGGVHFSVAPQTRAPSIAPYYRAVNWLSTAFALMTDCSMFVLGGALRRRERISARLGDVLAELYLASSVLKRFAGEHRPQADLPYVHWALQDALLKAQQGLVGVLDNFPNRILATLMRTVIFPFGLPHRSWCSFSLDRLGGRADTKAEY